MEIRKPDFAGSWYPGSAKGCEREISGFLAEGFHKSASGGPYVGGIVPHAGWFFSGGIACNVIYSLKADPAPDVIVIFGMHLRSGSPQYIMTRGAWETPLGDIAIDEPMAAALASRFDFTVETADRHGHDNTIELQLPFVKYFFPDTRIVPMGVPPVKGSLDIGKAVGEIAASMGINVKIIGSTDLTHYGFNYGYTPKGTGQAALDWVRNENDKRLVDALVAMDSQKVIAEATQNQNACCSGAAATAIAAVKALGAKKGESIAYATSHDKSPGDSFVGYSGVLFK